MGDIYQNTPKITMCDAIEKQVTDCQWIGGAQPSLADREAFEGLAGKMPNVASHPHAFAWFCLVARFADSVRQSWTAAAAPAAKGGKADAKKGGKKEAPKKEAPKPVKKEEEDCDDLFGSDDDEEAAKEAAFELKAKAQNAKKAADLLAKGKVIIAKSIVIWDVKPFSSETDLTILANKILAIDMDGLAWKTEWKKEPVAFGIFKIQIGAVIEDAKISTDDVAEMIENMMDPSAIDAEDNEEGYLAQSTEIVVFNKL